MAWEKNFKLGVEHFKNNRCEEALKSFDQAIKENSQNRKLYDSRAAALEKLDRPLDALRDSKRVIDLTPHLWQGYARSARLFLHLGKPAASLKMIDLALERLKHSDEKRRAELEALREKAAETVKPPPCHFSKLPLELQTEIFTLVAVGSNRKMLALTLVCRHWREVIIHNPKFWRHLTLTPSTTLKKADTWLERGRGILSSLSIRAGFKFAKKPKVFKNAASTLWSSLDELEIISHDGNFRSILPTGALDQLRPQSLILVSTESSGAIVEALRQIDASRLQKLDLTTGPRYFSLGKLPFSGLTTLELSGTFTYQAILILLERNPLLETLRIFLGIGEDETVPEVPNRIDLPHLKCLDFSDSQCPDIFLRKFLFPDLQSFRLLRGSGDAVNSCIEDLRSRNLTILKEFGLIHCNLLSLQHVISFLHISDELETLTITSCSFKTGDINSMVDALVEMPPDGKDGISQSIPCPKLQCLNLSTSPSLKAGPLARLVKAHFPRPTIVAGPAPAPAPDEGSDTNPMSSASSSIEASSQVVPIRSLVVDECELIDPNALRWFQASVPSVSWKIKPMKLGRAQR